MSSRRLRILTVLSLLTVTAVAYAQESRPPLETPRSIRPGCEVVTLWTPDQLQVIGSEMAEKLTMKKTNPDEIQSVENIHNPSIELRPAPADKRNGVGVIVAGGGGNSRVIVGFEGTDAADWLNSLGISAYILRYRLKPYASGVEAQADSLRAIRMVRAHAQEWGVDPERIGFMGFSAGAEQAARVVVNFDHGNPNAADPLDRVSSRPDFSILVYAGWRDWDFSNVPEDAPPTFMTCAGIGDDDHARKTVQFYSTLFEKKIPVELHIYGKGKHGGAISPRNGIPFGTWHERCLEWMRDDLQVLSGPVVR